MELPVKVGVVRLDASSRNPCLDLFVAALKGGSGGNRVSCFRCDPVLELAQPLDFQNMGSLHSFQQKSLSSKLWESEAWAAAWALAGGLVAVCFARQVKGLGVYLDGSARAAASGFAAAKGFEVSEGTMCQVSRRKEDEEKGVSKQGPCL